MNLKLILITFLHALNTGQGCPSTATGGCRIELRAVAGQISIAKSVVLTAILNPRNANGISWRAANEFAIVFTHKTNCRREIDSFYLECIFLLIELTPQPAVISDSQELGNSKAWIAKSLSVDKYFAAILLLAPFHNNKSQW